MRLKTLQVFLISLLLLFPASVFGLADPLADWPTFYEGFERTVDVELDDGASGPIDTEQGKGGDKADYTYYIRDAITAREGTRYLVIKGQWGAPEDCSSHTGDKGYGRIGFERGYFLLRGAELLCDNGDDVCFNIDDGYEYWVGWSQYIPADEKEQLTDQFSGLFQIHGNQGLGYISYWGEEQGEMKVTRHYDSGTTTNKNLGDWIALKGTWVDMVMHIQLYTSDNANARMRVYVNGVLSGDTDDWDGLRNARTGTTRPYPGWQNYNWWHCGDTDFDVDCTTTQTGGGDNYCGCANGVDDGSNDPDCAGDWTDWDRNYIIDALRFNEYSTGQGDNYCDVAPSIWSTTPIINTPVQNADGVATTFTAQFDGYADHRTDAQNCFDAYKMKVQVDEDGGDWASLVYDSGSVNSANTHEISGLSANTNYQMRVAQSSYNSDRSEEYWGDWSATRDFNTAPPASTTLGTHHGGGVSGGSM